MAQEYPVNSGGAVLAASWRKYPCKEWQGKRNYQGYGCVTREGREWRVHRLEWTLKRGPIPPGMCVLHHCDNPPCYEINHLFLGTRANKGGHNKGGQPPHLRGEQHGRAKLTWAQVREIRRRHAAGGIGYRRLGAEYGVHGSDVQQIINGKIWKQP